MAVTGKTDVVDELRALGHFGGLTFELLVKLTREELRRFPALTSDPVSTHEDYVSDFFAARGKALTAAALLEAEDDDAVGRMFRRWVRNWLIDLHTSTAIGALRDRLEKRLARDSHFERAPAEHHWGLAEGPSDAGRNDVAALTTVARRVHVTFYPEPPGGKRRAQLGKPGELEALLGELFLAAQGSLHISTLVAVLANRFPHVLDPSTVSTDEDVDAEAVPAPELSPLGEMVQQEEHQLLDSLARGAFDRLSVEERELVLVLDDSKAAAQTLGLGRSATAVRIRALKSKLIEIAGDEVTAPEVLRRVIALCAAERRPQEPSIMDASKLVPSLQDGGQNP